MQKVFDLRCIKCGKIYEVDEIGADGTARKEGQCPDCRTITPLVEPFIVGFIHEKGGKDANRKE